MPRGPLTPTKVLLRERGLTIKDLAAAIGRDAANTGYVVNGVKTWAPMRQAIADHLGVTVEELWPDATAEAGAR